MHSRTGERPCAGTRPRRKRHILRRATQRCDCVAHVRFKRFARPLARADACVRLKTKFENQRSDAKDAVALWATAASQRCCAPACACAALARPQALSPRLISAPYHPGPCTRHSLRRAAQHCDCVAHAPFKRLARPLARADACARLKTAVPRSRISQATLKPL
jgi:hypothetical protein